MIHYEKLIIVFAEGEHDIVLLYRILKTLGAKGLGSTQFKDYPIPAQNILKGSIQKKLLSLDLISFESIHPKPFPIYSMKLEKIFLLLYAMGSKDKIEETKKIIQSYIDEYYSLDSDQFKLVLGLNFIFFLDADNNKKEVFNKFKKDYQDVLNFNIENSSKQECENANLFPLKDNSIIKKVGLYILSNQENKGSLESIVLPLIEKSVPNQFKKSKEFVDINFPPKKESGEQTKYDIDKNKAIIGVAGQTSLKIGKNEFTSGKSNTVILKESELIKDEILEVDPEIKSIKEFFKILLKA